VAVALSALEESRAFLFLGGATKLRHPSVPLLELPQFSKLMHIFVTDVLSLYEAKKYKRG
jgi:hypothetical protein